jgi:hypothetical protein
MRSFLIFLMVCISVFCFVEHAHAADTQKTMTGVLLKPLTPNAERSGKYFRQLTSKEIKKQLISRYYNPKNKKDRDDISEEFIKSAGGIGTVGDTYIEGDVAEQQAMEPQVNESPLSIEEPEQVEQTEIQPTTPSAGGIGQVGGGIGHVTLGDIENSNKQANDKHDVKPSKKSGGIGGVGDAGVQSE